MRYVHGFRGIPYRSRVIVYLHMGPSLTVKWVAAMLVVMGAAAEIVGALLIVMDISDDADELERRRKVGHVQLRPDSTLRQIERAIRHFRSEVASFMEDRLVGRSNRRWYGVVLLAIGIVLGAAGSLVALLG